MAMADVDTSSLVADWRTGGPAYTNIRSTG